MPSPDAALTIHLLCMQDKDRAAYLRAAQHSPPPPSLVRSVSIHDCALAQLPASVRLDAVVSPANAYGRLDGAFDDALSRALAPANDYHALTRAAQAVLWRDRRGYANPGSCTLVRLPASWASAPAAPAADDDDDDDDGSSAPSASASSSSRNVWGVRHVLLCPTMRVPENVTWDREIVYRCVWSMLCAVDAHNRAAAAAGDDDDDRIASVLMTPLATGVGRVNENVWAAQLLLAMRHFDLALRNHDEFAALDVERILTLDGEIRATYESNLRNGDS